MMSRLPILVVNHLVLNLRSYSHPLRELELVTSNELPLSDLRFHYSKTLGNIGAPLDYGLGTNSLDFVEDGRETDGSGLDYRIPGRTAVSR